MSNFCTYILTSKDFSIDTFKEKMPHFVEKYRGKEVRDKYKKTYPLQPLTQIHLSNMKGEFEPGRDIQAVYIFSAIALFILLIACLNYINLATARFMNRAKEVELRKVLGASTGQLVKQFLGESFLFALIALPLAVLLAVFIACLGLLGLTTFAIEQRTKEIAIRKVLGASAVRIALLLSKEFTRWIVAANIFAWLIAWYAMNQWLQNFTYRAGMGIWIFLSAGLIVLVIAWLTVSLKVVKAASSKPVDTLRYE